jgi:hypothetical protein
MNERIQLLAEQVGFYVAMFDPGNKDNAMIEKFAELIVKECANYIRENYDNWDAEPLAHNMEVDFGLHGDYA